MYIRKKMRTKLLILAVIIVAGAFVYWRGVKATTEQKGWACNYHLAYAVCSAKNNKAVLPGFMDIMRAGVKF